MFNNKHKNQVRIKKQYLDRYRLGSQDIVKWELFNDDIFHWRVWFKGPNQSPFQNGYFLLDIIIPNQYPYIPPKIKFITKIFHPHISQNGEICLDILKDEWSPQLTIPKTILSIISLLTDINAELALKSGQKMINNTDYLNPQIAIIYQNNPNQFAKIAKQWTLKYAKKPQNL